MTATKFQSFLDAAVRHDVLIQRRNVVWFYLTCLLSLGATGLCGLLIGFYTASQAAGSERVGTTAAFSRALAERDAHITVLTEQIILQQQELSREMHVISGKVEQIKSIRPAAPLRVPAPDLDMSSSMPPPLSPDHQPPRRPPLAPPPQSAAIKHPVDLDSMHKGGAPK